MTTVVFDFEGTINNNCNVYDPEAYVCLLVVKVISDNSESTLSFTKPWDVGRINEILSSANLLVGFNLKFDLSWARREFGFIPEVSQRIYDCQYAEFLFSNQTWKFPDLRSSCIKREVQNKLDFIHENYWSKGIDTKYIPPEELEEYCIGDVQSTWELYQVQMKLFQTEYQHLWRLFRLHMLDLPVLLEMEWNGLKYNHEKSLQLAESCEAQISKIEETLNSFFDFKVDWGSSPQKSAVLYGGQITTETRVPVGTYKTGQKVGQVRYKIVKHTTIFERLVEPIKGSELATDGLWSTDEATLRSVKAVKRIRTIIDLILERAKLVKMNSSYLTGLPKKLQEMRWGDYLHPSYNQCVAVTGRIASSNPNGQNMPGEVKKLCESRF